MRTQKKAGKRRPIMAPVMDPERGTLNRIRARAKGFGFKPADVRPFTLRMYAKLTNTSSSLTFQTNVVNTSHPAEILLEKSDAFFANKVGLGVHKVKVVNGQEYPANTPILHYEDPNWFAGPAIAPGIATESESVGMLYNAELGFKTDQDIRLEVFDTRRLRTVPEVQYDPNAPITLPVQDGSEMKNLASNFGIWGNKRNAFDISLKNGDYSAIAGTATGQNYAVVLVDGFLIVRGAEALTLSNAAKLFRGL